MRPMRTSTAVAVLLSACTGDVVVAPQLDSGQTFDAGTPDAGPPDAGPQRRVVFLDAGLLIPDGGTGEEPAPSGFSWRMAGAFIVGNDPLTATAPQLLDAHFSYVGNYAMNNCANNTPPYSCAANGCTYPGNPGSNGEIPTYAQLAQWLKDYQAAGLYVGLWGVTTTNAEAEGHCFAEIANTLRAQHGITVDLIDVDGEKAYETVQSASQRFVTEFNATLQFPVAKAYTPECHTAVPMAPWLNGGFTSIMPMAYWNDVNVNPAYCLEWAYAYGVPKAYGQVMLDAYRHGTPHTWAEYADDIARVQAQGFSVWRTLNANEWSQFKTLIETKGIAVYGTQTAAPSGPMQVTASSGTTAPRLIDGDVTTRALSNGWLMLDLGTARLTDFVRLWNGRMQGYTLDADANDCAFDDSARVVDAAMAPAGAPTLHPYALRLTRCLQLQAKAGDMLEPGELEVHRNLAREATVTASSTYDAAGYPLSNLVNGKRADFPHTRAEDGAWLALDFGRARTIDRVVLWNRLDCCQDRLKSYVIELDANDCAFDDALTLVDVTARPAGAPSSWAFEPLTARCLRLRQKENMPLHPGELQVFGY